jgi:hypothetical protein
VPPCQKIGEEEIGMKFAEPKWLPELCGHVAAVARTALELGTPKTAEDVSRLRSLLAELEAGALELEDLSRSAKLAQDRTGEAMERAKQGRDIPFDSLKDLPPELLSQLSVAGEESIDLEIVDLIREAGGAASLDRILIDLYRKTGKVHERTKLNQRLYRMAKTKGMIYSVPKARGVYSIEPQDDGAQFGTPTIGNRKGG